MASTGPQNIIIAGNPSGDFTAVLTKLATLHTKTQFSFAIILGNLFPSPETLTEDQTTSISSLLADRISIPLPVYFTLGTYPLPPKVLEKIDANAGEVCSNLFYLGKRSTLTTSEGVKIVTLGGRLDPNLTTTSKDHSLPFYTDQDASTLRGANNADILITNEWPASISTGSKVQLHDDSKQLSDTGNKSIAKLASSLRPRYHFSVGAGAGFYEREPYLNDRREKDGEGAEALVTRFIALAEYGNQGKGKWLYAFKLDLSSPATTVPPNCTSSPYAALTGGSKRHARRDDDAPGGGSFFWGEHVSGGGHHHGGHRNKRARHDYQRPPPPGPESCFFCLSNPNIQKHLITSIGNSAYLTTAKGPLTTHLSNPKLGFPGHILVIPFEHTPTLAAIQDDETKTETVEEMTKYRNALRQMYSKLECGMVTWEVVRRNGVHTHWQVVPIPKRDIGKLRSAFEEATEAEAGLEGVEEREVEEKEEGDYFRVWVDGLEDEDADANAERFCFVMKIKERVRFDLQFGRRVVAGVLGLEDRVNWKDCGQEADEEIRDAEGFKKAFKEYDFSFEE